jgi:glutaredoxin
VQSNSGLFKVFLTLAVACLVYLEIGTDPASRVSAPAETGAGGGDAGTVSNLNVEQMFRDLGGVSGDVPVMVFTTSWCGVCRALQTALTKKGVRYLPVDIEASLKARSYYESAIDNAPSHVVPLTVVGTKRFIGFMPDEIERAIQELIRQPVGSAI